MLLLGYCWAIFFDKRRQAKKYNEKPDHHWISLILLTVICLSPIGVTYIGVEEGQNRLVSLISLYYISLIISAILWMILWIQTDGSRLLASSWNMKTISPKSEKTGFAVIKRSKGQVLEGDVFVFRFEEDSDYYYGRILATKLMADDRDPMADGSHVAFIFSSKTKSLNMENLNRNYQESAMGPFLVMDLYWRKGYFFTVGNIPLSKEEKNLDYGFMMLIDDVEPIKEKYYDKKFSVVSTIPTLVAPAYHIPMVWLCDLLKRVLSKSGEKTPMEYFKEDLMNTTYQV